MARRRQRVTIKHVAADAGVSLQTVSRVINKEPNVRAEMAERVQASIDRLGYVPSIAAQRMGGSRSYLIVALNDRQRTIEDWRNRQGTDWVDQMLLGGMLTCAEHGYRMIVELVDTHSDHIERELSAALAALQPDGVILTPPHSHNPLITGLLAEQHICFARIGSLVEGAGFRLTMDDQHAAVLATEHLLELGHRRVGFIAGPGDVSLVSFDDTPIMRFTHPPLTAVVQPIAEVTARAVELLIAAHGGGEREGAPVVVPARLTVRESTAAPRR